jgi:hypothetical protein
MSTQEQLEKTPGKRLYDIQIAFLMDKMDSVSKNLAEMKATTEQWREGINKRCEQHSKDTMENRILLESKANREEMDIIRQSSFRNTVYISLLATLPHLIAIVGGIVAIIVFFKGGK